MEFDVNQYRERSTADIANEQKELERLRRLAIVRGGAWWEFHGNDYRFTASKSWQTMTGFDPAEVFPSDLHPVQNPIEPLLDNLVDRFCQMVIESDRGEFKKKATDFLLWSRESKVFDHGFRMVDGTGKVIAVWAIAHSVWEKGRLQSLFCQLRNIDRLTGVIPSAVAISKNTDKLKDVGNRLDQTAKLLDRLGKWWPYALAALISFNSGLEGAIKHVTRLIEIIAVPIQSVRAPFREKREILPDSVTAEKLDKSQQAMQAAARLGTVTLGVYDPGAFPGKFQYLIQSSSRQNVLFGGDSSFTSVSQTPSTAAMTDLHIGGSVYESRSDGSYLYSVPFTITRSDGQVQTFFVEIESTTTDAVKISEIQAESLKLSGIVRDIFIGS